MRYKLMHLLLPLSLILLPGLVAVGPAQADPPREMKIDIQTDDIQLDSLDISHLAIGDSETIYTDDGRTVDVLRTAQGIDIFIDGEKLGLPSLHSVEHGPGTDHASGHSKILVIRETHEMDDSGVLMMNGDTENYEIIIARDSAPGDDEL